MASSPLSIHPRGRLRPAFFNASGRLARQVSAPEVIGIADRSRPVWLPFRMGSCSVQYRIDIRQSGQTRLVNHRDAAQLHSDCWLSIQSGPVAGFVTHEECWATFTLAPAV